MGRAPRSAFFVCLLALGMLATMLAPVAAEGVFGLDRGFAPMGSAYHWRPSLVGLHLVADTLIGLSYVAISVTLIYLAYKARHDIPFLWTFVAFGVFIIACGATHLMATVTIWVPLYWVAAAMKWVTAIASVCTAITLPPLVPQALALIHTAKLSDARRVQLEVTNAELAVLTERLREVDQLKTQFFANVSHELRTPLALILGPLEKLHAAAELTEDQHHDVEVATLNACTLLTRVNDLLDISKMEAGRMELRTTDVDLAELLHLTAAHFETLAQERGVAFAVETPPSAPAHADPEKLQRVFLNLLSNAFKFTPEGGRVRCVLGIADEHVAVAIQNSGSGVPPALREAIFD